MIHAIIDISVCYENRYEEAKKNDTAAVVALRRANKLFFHARIAIAADTSPALIQVWEHMHILINTCTHARTHTNEFKYTFI